MSLYFVFTSLCMINKCCMQSTSMPLENTRSINVYLYCCSFVIPHSSSDQSVQGLTFKTTKFSLFSRFFVVYCKNKNVFTINCLKRLMKTTHELEGWCLFYKKEKQSLGRKWVIGFEKVIFINVVGAGSWASAVYCTETLQLFRNKHGFHSPFVMLENIP